MKRTLILAALAFGTADMALAAPTVWTGDGQMFDAQRNPLATYSLRVEIENLSPNQERRVVVVSNPKGVIFQDTCTVDKGGDKWATTCTHSSGGGYTFGRGLAQEYLSGDDGVDHVTQIIEDSPTSMRLLRTELESGNATMFFIETLAKVAE